MVLNFQHQHHQRDMQMRRSSGDMNMSGVPGMGMQGQVQRNQIGMQGQGADSMMGGMSNNFNSGMGGGMGGMDNGMMGMDMSAMGMQGIGGMQGMQGMNAAQRPLLIPLPLVHTLLGLGYSGYRRGRLDPSCVLVGVLSASAAVISKLLSAMSAKNTTCLPYALVHAPLSTKLIICQFISTWGSYCRS